MSATHLMQELLADARGERSRIAMRDHHRAGIVEPVAEAGRIGCVGGPDGALRGTA